jgi:hypothetical protein
MFKELKNLSDSYFFPYWQDLVENRALAEFKRAIYSYPPVHVPTIAKELVEALGKLNEDLEQSDRFFEDHPYLRYPDKDDRMSNLEWLEAIKAVTDEVLVKTGRRI